MKMISADIKLTTRNKRMGSCIFQTLKFVFFIAFCFIFHPVVAVAVAAVVVVVEVVVVVVVALVVP